MRGPVSRDTGRQKERAPKEGEAQEGRGLPGGITTFWEIRTLTGSKTLKWGEQREASLR
jgi:hypothetical protein